jgi:hypothetical protein
MEAYVRARQEIGQKDPGLSERLAELRDASAEREQLQAVLAGSQMSAAEFIRVHGLLQQEPALRAQVEAKLQSVPTAGGAAMTGVAESRRAAGQMSEETLRAYVQSRQQVERSDPGLKAAMESGNLSAERERLRLALSGALMSDEEFIQAHREIQGDPSLRARATAALQSVPPTGASGAAARDPRAPEPTGGAVPLASPRGGTASGAAPSDAQPGASPR